MRTSPAFQGLQGKDSSAFLGHSGIGLSSLAKVLSLVDYNFSCCQEKPLVAR